MISESVIKKILEKKQEELMKEHEKRMFAKLEGWEELIRKTIKEFIKEELDKELKVRGIKK